MNRCIGFFNFDSAALLSSVNERLCATKVCEQVTDLLGDEVIEQSFGHQRLLGGPHGVYRRSIQGRIVAVAVAEDDDVLVLLDDHTGKDATVAGGDDRAGESFANFGAGIDDVQEHRLQIIATESRQVGAEFSTSAEERMAPGACLFKDFLAGLGNSGSFADHGGKVGDPGVMFGRRNGFERSPETGDCAVDRGIAEQHQLFHDFFGNTMSVDCPGLDGFEEFDASKVDATRACSGRGEHIVGHVGTGLDHRGRMAGSPYR